MIHPAHAQDPTAYAPGRTLSGYLAEHGPPLTGATLYACAAGPAS
ncbi:hypothetical protein ACFWIJ_21170 [Streptomyces sp. NPDC127079]